MSDTCQPAINNYVDFILRTEALEENFAGFIIKSHTADNIKKQNYESQMRTVLKELETSEKIEAAVREYVNLAANVLSNEKVTTLLSMLEFAVNNNLLPAKLVCEALLTSDKLDYENEVFCICCYKLIHRIISFVDYKGVRDLLKVILIKIHLIPQTSNISLLSQLDVIYKLLEYIFNRECCLLPAYLILDEIKKIYPQGHCPHWKFAKLFFNFVDTFRPIAQMVSISGRSKLLPIVGYSSTSVMAWKLDPDTAKFQLRGLLPYNKELSEPQTKLLRYVLEQPYSRDMICAMLNLSNKLKQRCPVLENQLVELIMIAMERSENEPDLNDVSDYGSNQILFLWQHISCHLIYFVLFNHISFSHMVLNLRDKLEIKNFRKGREHLMWVLLQFISGSIQKNQLVDLLPILKLYDLLYPEKEPLPVPDVTKPGCTHSMAISSIWIHLMKKAELEPQKLQRPLPQALKHHVEFLQQNLMSNNLHSNLSNDYMISLLCNAYSTNQECFTRPMGILVESVQGNQRNYNSNSIGTVNGPMVPLSMNLLDSLTVHTKMSLIHNIVNHITKSAQSKSPVALPPALIETYSRLLIYTELETLGIKGFMQQVLTTVGRSQAWGILHTLFEMFIYRLHHIHPHYRIQLLGHLHQLSNLPQTNQAQLHSCMKSTALKLILGLSCAEVLGIPQFARFQNEPKAIISVESEELNKVLVLALATAIHVTGCETFIGVSWCKELLTNIMQTTPLAWSSFTLMCFPPIISEFFQQYAPVKENKIQLKRSVEEEYRKWITMNNENDIIAHFSTQGTPPLFLCLLWKMLLENDRINPIAYKILDRIGARALSAHLRTLADFLVYEFTNLLGGQIVGKYIEKLNDLIWKCHVITLDRLLLCLALRAFEGNEAQVCLFIIQMLLLRTNEFQNRVMDFVRDNSSEHWKQSNWHEKHVAFHRKYPEKFYFEGLTDITGQNQQHTYLPVYFSNVCLRFLPVLDIIIHRYLELPTSAMSIPLDSLLDKFGPLYKFHDRPLTYLYNTLHYYESKLKDRPQLKRKLVSSIIGSLKDIKPVSWALSDVYLHYSRKPPDDTNWLPDLEYYIKLIGKVVDTLNGRSPFPHIDWRFNEFSNAGAHILHVTCIELMALPVSASTVANNLLDIVMVGHKMIPRANIESWMNAIGVVITALPEPYWSVINDRIIQVFQSPFLTSCPHPEPFCLMDFTNSHCSMTGMQASYLIALAHSVFLHASIGQISLLPSFLRERIKPEIKTEEQFLFICHIIAPYLHRLNIERTRVVIDLTKELYSLLEVIDKTCENLRFVDPICDLLYHIKYMFIGDCAKSDIEAKIRNLRPALQMRLQFMTHLNVKPPA